MYHRIRRIPVFGKYLAIFVAFAIGILAVSAWAGDYILGAEDVIQVAVWGNPGLGVSVPIRPDGKISLPLGEDIVAAGKTPAELRQAIGEELSKYIKEPAVSVVVQQVNSPRIHLLGNHPGTGERVLRSDTTLLQLISSLGPIDELDLERVYMIRDHKRLDLDLRDLVEKGQPEKDILLQRGDIIHIPNAFSRRITVIGEVTRPSNVAYRRGITVVDAIIEAGWVTEFANLKKVTVVREAKNGQEAIPVNVSDIKKGENLDKNIKLMPGDLVIVGERLF